MLALAVTAGLIALPMLYLTGGSGRTPMPRLIHWDTGLNSHGRNVLKYLGFAFGLKWLLIAGVDVRRQPARRLFSAALSLIAVAFSFQFTTEVFANQKFLHIWVVIANLFVAFALWRLWRFSLRWNYSAREIRGDCSSGAVIQVASSIFPIHNTGWSEVVSERSLIDWLKNTTHGIFSNGPICYSSDPDGWAPGVYGWSIWSAGYNAANRDRVYTSS